MALSLIRVGQGKSLFFVVAVLLSYVTVSDSLACPSSYTSEELARCHGRCADIHRASPNNYSVCVNACCGISDQLSHESSSLPTDCPFSELNCSVPDGHMGAPVAEWRNGMIVLQLNSTAVSTGTNVCSTLTSDNPTSTSTPVVQVQVQDVTTNTSTYWLLFAGMKNELNEVSAGCYTVSVATVTKCGRSEFSQPYTLPPQVDIDEVDVSISSDMDDLPVINISWHTSGDQDVSVPVTNITMYAPVDNSNLPYECPTASKLTHGNSGSAQFFSEDFLNGSVWLCTYDIHISLAYWSDCTATQNSAVGMSTGNFIFISNEISTWVESYRFLWNETALAYTLFINWTVPAINGFRNIVENFHLRVLYPIPKGNHLYQAFTVKSVKGKYHYDMNFAGYLPLAAATAAETFFYPPGTDPNVYVISLTPIFSLSHVPFNHNINTISLAAPGEPPSSVGNLEVVRNDSKVVVLWEEPIVTNGGITSYTVEITLLGSNGKLKTSVNSTNETTFGLDISSLNLGVVVTSVFVKVAANNQFQAGAFSNATHTYPVSLSPVTENPSLDTVTVTVVVVVLVFISVLLLIAVVLIVVWRYLQKGKQKSKFSVRWHRGTQREIDSQTSLPQLRESHWSFSQLQAKLPPDIEDRWNIAYNSFVPESFRLLGSGNFSTVYLCRVKAPITTPTNLAQFQAYADQAVAVKLLKGNATEQEIYSFFNEADVMKRLSSQSCNYVVQLVGLQVEQAPVMIAMELVPCGNLLDILKSSRISDESDGEVFLDPTTRSSGSLKKKKMLQKTDTQLTLVEFQLERSGSIDSYVQLRHHSFSKGGSPDTPQDPQIVLKPSQLLKFALQVSRGMEYLISCRVLHRDLACRNLLLGSNGIVKISDFGLACYFEDENHIVSDLPTEQKPLRWMAPEAYTHNIFSEASDVWSFGITVWEMFSKGVFPYASMSDAEALSSIVGGCTLERPTDSDPEIYSIMLQCWKLDSKERPSFASLVKLLDQFIYKLYPYMMMEIQECANEDGSE